MTAHAPHESLPGYDPAQILHDGCEECESRAASRSHGLSYLDQGRFARAWKRAGDWNRDGLSGVAKAEVPLLDVLWAMQVQLENLGWTIGELPRQLPADLLADVAEYVNGPEAGQ